MWAAGPLSRRFIILIQFIQSLSHQQSLVGMRLIHLIMARKSSLGVSKETRERVHDFKAQIRARSVDAAINEALDVAESETEADPDRIEKLGEKQDTLSAAFIDLRDRVEALEEDREV